MGPTIGLLALLLGASFVMEGLNTATGGEVYLASVRKLAEASSAAVLLEATTTGQISSPPATISPLPTLPLQPIVPSQDLQPPQPPPPSSPLPPLPGQQEGVNEESPQDFVDPREIQQTLREIRDLQSQLRQVINQLRKLPAFAEDLGKMNAIAAELAQFSASIRTATSGAGGSAREVIQDFRDNQYWDQVNAVRTKIELPREIKQIEAILRRLKRTLSLKAVQNLGFNIGAVQARIAEMEQEVASAKAHLAAGNAEEAQEAMRAFHEGGHPGEIEGTIYRIRDIKQMLKRVKDEQIRGEVDRVLQPVIEAVNAGEYMDARETMDEYADDLQRLIQRFLAIRVFQGKSRQDSFSRIRNLDELIRAKLNEPDGNQPQRAQ